MSATVTRCVHAVCCTSDRCLVVCRLCGGPGEPVAPNSDLAYCTACWPGDVTTCDVCGGEGVLDRKPCVCALGVADGYVNTIRDPQGGRNLIRSGDVVKVSGSAPGKHSFDATFVRAKVTGGRVVEVDVFGGTPNHEKYRSFFPERIHRRRGQSKQVA